MLKDIYEEISSLLLTLETPLHIDLWQGQYLDAEEGRELEWVVPAIFIEFGLLPTEELGRKMQETNATVTLHIVSEALPSESSQVSPPSIRDLGLAHLDRIDRVHKLLSGRSGTAYNSLMRESINTDTAPSEIFVHQVQYSTRLRDMSAMRTYIRVTPGVTIDPTLNT